LRRKSFVTKTIQIMEIKAPFEGIRKVAPYFYSASRDYSRAGFALPSSPTPMEENFQPTIVL